MNATSVLAAMRDALAALGFAGFTLCMVMMLVANASMLNDLGLREWSRYTLNGMRWLATSWSVDPQHARVRIHLRRQNRWALRGLLCFALVGVSAIGTAVLGTEPAAAVSR